MAAVQVEQTDLDDAVVALRTLVEKLNGVDLTPLPTGDVSGLVSAVADVTTAVNRLAPSTPDVPAPNPEPEPTETPDPEPVDEGDA